MLSEYAMMVALPFAGRHPGNRGLAGDRRPSTKRLRPLPLDPLRRGHGTV